MKKLILFFTIALAFIVSCESDDSVVNNNQVAFTTQNIPVSEDPVTVAIAFNNPTADAGQLTIRVTPENVEYDTDFTIDPVPVEDHITIPFDAQTSNLSFTFQPLTAAVEGQQKSVTLKIIEISLGAVAIPEATASVELIFGESPVATNTMTAAMGGANLPNQVYVDLSSGTQTGVLRSGWDLAFSSGSDFRVGINGSVKMAVKQVATNNIEDVVAIDPTVAVGLDNGSGIENGNIAYTDNPNGDIGSTVISVSESDEANNVYLINLGYALSGETPPTGEVDPYGSERGWMKIRVLRDGDDYKLRYAAPEATTYTEVTIPKDAGNNFTFFSLTEGAVATVQPAKEQWDLNFTTFTDHIDFGSGAVSYAVADFVALNNLGGARAVQVLESAGTSYEEFSNVNVTTSMFATPLAADQRAIGSNWRNGEPDLPSVKEDRFYVVRDPAGNLYKLRFLSLSNDQGERGYITFEYELLQ